MSQELNKDCAICRDIGDICVSGEERASPVPPANEWEKLARHLAYYLPSALVSHQHMMTPETLSDALEALHKVRNMPAPPSGGEVEVLAWRVLGYNFNTEAFALEYSQWAEDVEPVRYLVDRAHVTRLQAENAALQQRLNTADQRVDELQKDNERLDALEANYWDVRHHSSALGDTGDYTSCVEIVGHWMDKPNERVIGENYNENLRAAIDQAMTADAYPPARPEYPELDAALAEEDWHMNPCKQGHRDVGACQGKAFCHTCDETITAETTQQAFEHWNATHPAVPQ